MKREVEVVIVGGGISGCATAYYLARRGTKVALFEKGDLAGEASGRNWGFVRQGGRNPVEMPLMAVSLRLWRELQDGHNIDLGFVQEGQVVPIESEEDLALFEQRIQMGRDYGLNSRIISVAAMKELVPPIGGPWIAAMYSPEDGLAEPRKATSALAAAATQHGAEIYTNCAVEGIASTGGKVKYVATEQGEFVAPTIVCAAGVWSPRVAKMVGFNLPTKTVRSTVAATQACAPLTKLGIWGPYVAFRQTASGHFHLGNGYRPLGYASSRYRQDRSDGLGQPGPVADYDVTLDSFRNLRLWLPSYLKNRRALSVHVGRDFVGDIFWSALDLLGKKRSFAHLRKVEPGPNRQHVAYRLKHFCEVMPSLSGIKIERAWAGYIDTSPDGIAVLGEIDCPKGFVLAGPFCGHGFAMGPVTGRLVSELILDGKPSLDIRALRPTRLKEGAAGSPVRIL